MLKLNRRIVLRGLGGAVVAAPFLGSLYERSAKAVSGRAPAKSMILMFTHYGCVTNKWFPSKLEGELTADDLVPTSLAPLAPFAKKLLLPRGIRTMNEWTAQNTGVGKGRGQGNDMHTQEVASALTCQPVTPNSNNPFDFATEVKNAMPIGPSIDHVIAQQLSPQGVPLLLNTVGQTKEAAFSAVSYSGPEQVFPAKTAVEAYSSLTGLFGERPMGADSWQLSKGKLLADIVKEDLATLSRQDMSRDDRDKLSAWTELLNDVSQVMVGQHCSQTTATMIGANATLGSGTGDALTRAVSDTMDNADLYSAIAVLAAACNASPAIVLKYPGSFTFTGLGINSDSDLLAHRLQSAGLDGPCAPEVVQKLLKIDAYYAQKFANLVKMLDSLQDNGRTLLDSSIALWMSECSDGSARNTNNSPIIQAGGGSGYFKVGRIINLDSESGATAEDMLGHSLAVCVDDNDMADGTNQVTATNPSYGTQPVNKYFCNIMNAMGMVADASGYAAKNGNGEVTHFGYADRTEDFCGGAGAVADAGIHDPGPFAALKA